MADTDPSKWVCGKTAPLDSLYKLGQQIGQPGQFGAAYLVEHKKTNELRAVKVVSKSKFRSEQDRSFHFKQLRAEISIMKEMQHDNIIQFFEVFESAGHLYIVMECCKGGELFDRIKAQPTGSYTEVDASEVLKQIISGISYMHGKKIAHCDLKPDNFLFLDKSKASKLKIIDFGMSKHVQRRKYLTSFRGTPYYVAPEVLQGKYSEPCDIWSFGVVAFVMLFGYPPFHAESDEEIFKKIQKGFSPTTKKGYGAWFPQAIPASENAKDLISKCLEADAVKRCTAEEILEHPFFNGGASSEPLPAEVIKKLRGFTAHLALKTKVLGFMTDMMDKAELKALKETFKAIDTNNDGQITADELAAALKVKGASDTQTKLVESIMATADLDGDGVLSYEELCLTAVERKLGAKEERLWAAFCKFDKDLDGTITQEELHEVAGVTMAEAAQMVKEIDVDGDGKINYDEFTKMWMQKEVAGMGL